MSEMPGAAWTPESLYFEDVVEGADIPPLTKEISAAQMMMYGAATWDFMRIHYDAGYARSRGLEAPIVDGQMLGAFLAQMVVDWAGRPGALRKLGVRYRSFVFAGDTVTCKGTVRHKSIDAEGALVECDLVVENAKGEVVAGPATAVVALPRRAS